MTAFAHEFNVLFEQVLAGFASAAESRGLVEEYYRIGRETCRFCFAGNALVPLVSPALEHLALKTAHAPDLTIHAWDWTSADRPASILLDSLMRSLSWHWNYYINSRGELKGHIGREFMAAFHPGPDILSLLDVRNRRALYWVKDAKQLPWHESGSPMRTLLNWWTASRGYQFVHGGAIGYENKAALVVGKGGSGKSTTCLACLEAGLDYLGDDYSLVEIKDESRVFSLYNTAKLKGLPDLARFPGMSRHLVNPDQLNTEKAMMFLHKAYPDRIVSGMPLKAIFIPKIINRAETGIRPAGAAEALAALAPSTLFQLPGSAQPA